MIRVLIVDESAVLRQRTRLALESDPEIQIVGEAGSGAEALALAIRLQPAAITVAVLPSKTDGIETICRIMSEQPTPIVAVTSVDANRDSEIYWQASRSGAVSIVRGPHPGAAAEFDAFAAKLVGQVKLISAVKVVRRARAHSINESQVSTRNPNLGMDKPHQTEIIAIGSSTGGPAALCQILGGLPADFAAPIVIVQHMSFGFVHGLADWLNAACPLQVHVAKLGERIESGMVYIAPDDSHMVIDRGRRIDLKQTEPVTGFRPAIDVLFESVAQVYGANALGVILTGMGSDGAIGMVALHAAGAMTIAQDEASCVVFGMPKAAIARGAVRQVVPVDQIAQRMTERCMASKPLAMA